jgi:hypothetical protein
VLVLLSVGVIIEPPVSPSSTGAPRFKELFNIPFVKLA